jgi:hypothetical protein
MSRRRQLLLLLLHVASVTPPGRRESRFRPNIYDNVDDYTRKEDGFRVETPTTNSRRKNDNDMAPVTATTYEKIKPHMCPLMGPFMAWRMSTAMRAQSRIDFSS